MYYFLIKANIMINESKDVKETELSALIFLLIFTLKRFIQTQKYIGFITFLDSL